MDSLTIKIGLTAWLCFILAGCAGFESGDLGKEEFESNCATCHGLTAKGDGPQAPLLPTQPADLTILAKKNGGVFPASRVYEIIDGRLEVQAHGPRTMPIWGREFQVNVPDLPPDAVGDFNFRESTVQGKIQALVDYISRLQVTN